MKYYINHMKCFVGINISYKILDYEILDYDILASGYVINIAMENGP